MQVLYLMSGRDRKRTLKNELLFWGTAAGAVFFDLISKYCAFNGIFDSFPIIRYQVKNPGITFGVGIKGMNIPVIIIGCILVLFIICFRYRHSNLKTDIICALLAGGALGNIYDRIRFGYVRDFIQWPTFNLADVFICAGVGYFIVDSLYRKEDYNEPGKGNRPSDK